MLTNALNAGDFYYADCSENWPHVAGQRFRVGSRHVHIGGTQHGSLAYIIRGLRPINQNGKIVHPVAALDADTLTWLDYYGIAVEEVEPGKYRAAVPIRFESYYRIVQGRATLEARYS